MKGATSMLYKIEDDMKIQPIASTEKLIYAQLKNWLGREGTLIRIENVIIPGLPDCLFIYDGYTYFLELKEAEGYKITCPAFQYNMAKEMSTTLHHHFHWYIVQEDGFLGFYKFSTLKRGQTWPTPGKERNLTIELRSLDPDFLVRGKVELTDWLIYIRNMSRERK